MEVYLLEPRTDQKEIERKSLPAVATQADLESGTWARTHCLVIEVCFLPMYYVCLIAS